ncbi:TIM barrel protein [Methyloglobulus sp.]|uniref:hydroxypyruvate isomerase family protein n=1 Tax=Methyloglobulus sp. TaxID=2518622 RepID=UPI0032B793FF
MKNKLSDSVRPELVEGRASKPLKFSANLSMLFSEFELIDRFQAAKACGFDAVEIQFPYSVHPEIMAGLLAEQQLKLVLFNVAAGDLLQGGEGLASVPEKKEQFEDAITQAVAYAHYVKPEAINILPGRCLDKRQKSRYLETFKENLLLAADTLAPLRIKAVFEAINTYDMPDFLVYSGKQMLSIVKQLKHPNLFMQYDIYHMHRMGENTADFIARHADKIGHIQFADCPGRGQPGTGEIDFQQFFSVIENSNYSGWCGAEYKPVEASCDSFGWLSK